MRLFIGKLQKVNPYNRMTSKYVAKSVSNFGAILITPSQLTSFACYTVEGQTSFCTHNVPPAPHKILHIRGYISRE